MVKRLALLLVFGAPVALLAQSAPLPNGAIVGAHSLALSPDGTRLAFCYLGDVWVAPVAGGAATPVTSHVEMDDNPVWSPDGKRLAFSSTRYGNPDIFVVGADGGRPKRVTYSSGAEIPSEWTPDGKEILFRGTRDASENGIYAVNVETGRFRPLLLDNMTVGSPKLSPDGARLLYTRFGFPSFRPRYQGSAASQLWTLDLKTGRRSPLRANGFQHLWPSWTAGGIYAVTVTERTPSTAPIGKSVGRVAYDVADTPNVYRIDGGGKAARKTELVGDAIDSARWLTAAKGADVFAYESAGDVYVVSGGKTKRLAITANADDRTTGEERLTLTTGATDADLSPDGASLVFTARNDVWRVPVKKGEGPNKDDAERLTDWAGTDEQPLYAPDGKAIFFVSDREGAERLYRMDLATKAVRAITTEDSDISNLALTPDKAKVAFWRKGKEGGLYTVNVDGTGAKRIFARPGAQPIDFRFSPDGRWVAYAEDLKDSGFYYWDRAKNLFLLEVATGKARDVTGLSAQHSSPAWSPDGRYLYFASDRGGEGIYVLSLLPEDVRGAEATIKYERPKDLKAPVKVEIDFDGIEGRVRKLAALPGIQAMLADPEDGSLLVLAGGDVSRTNANGEEIKRLTTGGGIGDVKFAPDGKGLVYVQNGAPTILNLRAPNTPATAVAFRAEWTRDVREERSAAFAQFWREYNRGFYDPEFHGRDWSRLRPKYARLLSGVGHQAEFAALLNGMVGELESSHSEVSANPPGVRPVPSAHLGFLFDYAYAGPGIKVLSVPAKTPGSYAKSRLVPGDVVRRINGKGVAPNEALYAEVLNGQVGRELVLSVEGADGKSREVKYRALAPGEFGGIVFNNLLEKRRRYVEAKSGGRLTYVQIAGMSAPELERFNQQVWQYAQDKRGLIIDVRNNGGGNTSDRIIDILERRQNSIYRLRDEEPIRGPGQALGVPMVVMANETSFSNAEMFPSAMRSRGLAKLVGKPTPGYVIYTYSLNLVDGTGARMPSTGSYRLDGTPMENNGQRPDYDVDWTAEQYLAGEDPQIDKAIEVLLREAK